MFEQPWMNIAAFAGIMLTNTGIGIKFMYKEFITNQKRKEIVNPLMYFLNWYFVLKCFI